MACYQLWFAEQLELGGGASGHHDLDLLHERPEGKGQLLGPGWSGSEDHASHHHVPAALLVTHGNTSTGLTNPGPTTPGITNPPKT